MEIERKFLVKNIPNLDGMELKNIMQCYLSFQPEIRIRNVNNMKYYITKKSDGILSREEIETNINEETFAILLDLNKSRKIIKTRYIIPLENNLEAELDIYHEELDGLVTVEIEFDSEEQAISFEFPEWFGEDVTSKKEYKNKNLAKCSKEELQELIKNSNPIKKILRPKGDDIL